VNFRTILLSALVCTPLTVITTVAAQAPKDTWSETKRFSAPEANQAAAADNDHFFAIDNLRVAKYDRRTGTRVAVSSGDAQHLNSGFISNSQLYCAHSNYPLKPEQSQIKVLDINTMQLTTWKDFANFGGSLTWAVLDQDHWWCNFALYGAENRGTFLVRFDRDWNELSRWTYPTEVTDHLGRYSLSGGIWQANELFVTGHDDRILYRLQLPDSGTVLKFIGKHSIPFTGQGIAVDPVTGGLVGIDRRRREVVFAGK
jgi:hypothetical protein